MNYAVTVTTTGDALNDVVAADLARLGAIVTASPDPRRCEATFTIEADDATSAAALAIEGIRAVRGEVSVDALEVVTTDERARRLTDSDRS